LWLFAVKEASWSRLFIFIFGALAAVFLAGFRILLWLWRRKRIRDGAYAKNVVIVGSPDEAGLIAERILNSHSRTQYRIMGVLCREETEVAIPAGLTRLGASDDLGNLAVHRPIHEVVATVGKEGSEELKQLVATCDYFRIVLRIVPGVLISEPPRDLLAVGVEDLIHLPALVMRPREFDSDALFLKRLIDIVCSAILLVLLSPVFAVVAVAIKITSPRLSIFYRWRVIGQNGVEFVGYKFTTMVANADAMKAELQGRNEMSGPVFKIKDDPRIIPLGKFLRKYSINELPQLWSVLKGDMSLVGPRPAARHELDRYGLWHKRKLCVQSGVTCLWQVRGRNAISDFDDWVKLDLEYIEHWSLWLDLKILWRTLWVVIRGTGS
jgi:exopolysaccharide biosynthesis polyprenyl glycosylphosphotransferase